MTPTPAPAPTPSLVNTTPADPAATPPAPAVDPAVKPADPAVDPAAAPKPEDAPKPDPALDTKANPFKVDEIKFSSADFAVDPVIGQELTAIVNEHGIPRNAVAALIGLQEKTMLANSEKSSREWDTLQEKWATEAKKDPEIGGDNWAKTHNQLGQLLDKFGSPEVRQALDVTGAGNHPAIIKFMSKIASQFSESGFISGNSAADSGLTLAQKMYPNQGK